MKALNLNLIKVLMLHKSRPEYLPIRLYCTATEVHKHTVTMLMALFDHATDQQLRHGMPYSLYHYGHTEQSRVLLFP